MVIGKFFGGRKLTNCEVTCDGLVSRPGEVEILLTASTAESGINSGSYEPVGSKASLT